MSAADPGTDRPFALADVERAADAAVLALALLFDDLFLHRTAIEDACAAGCSAYHMGDSAPGSQLALAQALAESGVQFDVLFAGDGRFNPDDLDRATLEEIEARNIRYTANDIMQAELDRIGLKVDKDDATPTLGSRAAATRRKVMGV